MRKYYLILSFIVSYSLAGRSQEYIARMNADSLKKELLLAKDTARINTLNLLSTRILLGKILPGSTDTSLRLAQEALLLSKRLKYNKGIGNALLNEAIVSIYSAGDFRFVLFNLQTALPLLKKAGDWFSVAAVYSAIGECYHNFGQNNTAIFYYDSCVHLFQQLHDTTTSAWTMAKKAHSYADLGNYIAAYKAFLEGVELTRKTDTVLLAFNFAQTAALFVMANLPEMALEYVNRIRAFYPPQDLNTRPQGDLPWFLGWGLRVAGEAYLQTNQIDSAFQIASYLNIPFEKQDAPDNLFYAHLYRAMGQHKKALFYFKHGYKLSLRNFYEIGHALHSIGLAETYFDLKNYSESIAYAREALRTAKKMHALREEQIALGIMSTLYGTLKDYSKAYYYGQLYKTLSDSLTPEEYKRKLSLMQLKDQLEIQRNEARFLSNQNLLSKQQIKIQESQLKRKSLLLSIFIGLFIVMVVLAILITRNIKLVRRKTQLQQLMTQVKAQQKLTELEQEKSHLEMQALRAQMNPHFIFNCLSSINRFILTNKIDEASDYLTKFSRLIRMALQNSEKSLVTLETDLEALRLYLDLERLRFKNSFNYNIILVNSIDSNTMYIPPMLIQPFAENAIWHGLMHKKNGIGRLDIQLCTTDKTLTCAIIDDGIGRNLAATFNSRSAEKNKSMGIKITAGRLELLNKTKKEAAIFEIEDLTDAKGNGCGTKVILTVPYTTLTEVNEISF